ncbi:hypothetical protein [Azotobacter beijerinckii]|nr:hypothetical protein [Azotobacter beijerinckii]
MRQIKMKATEQTIIAHLSGNHYPGFAERLAQYQPSNPTSALSSA